MKVWIADNGFILWQDDDDEVRYFIDGKWHPPMPKGMMTVEVDGWMILK